MGLNDVMARLKEPKAAQPTPTEQGLVLQRFQLDRILEALRISVRVRKDELKALKQRDRKSAMIPTLGNQINDYDKLIVLFRQEVERLKKGSESCPPTDQA